MQACSLDGRPCGIERHLHDAYEIKGTRVERERPAGDARDVEQIVDERRLGQGIALDRLERAPHGVGRDLSRTECGPSPGSTSTACAARERAPSGIRPWRGWPRPPPETGARCRWPARRGGQVVGIEPTAGFGGGERDDPER